MMMILHLILSSVAVMFVSYVVPGFDVTNFYSALLAAVVIGLINIIVRPLLLILTLPINIMTLGLFTFVINALMIMLASSIVKGFNVQGFIPAFIGAILLTIVNYFINRVISSAKTE